MVEADLKPTTLTFFKKELFQIVDTYLRKLLFFGEAVWVILIWLITVDGMLNNKQIK